MVLSTICASDNSLAKIDTQSNDLQAGTTPVLEMMPRVGFTPIRFWKAAGTLPDPAVSVPKAKVV